MTSSGLSLQSNSVLNEDDVRGALARILPKRQHDIDAVEMGMGTEDAEPARRYLASMREEGWALPDWPACYGGRDANESERALIERVRSEFEVPDTYIHMIGLFMVGPTLLDHGLKEQRDRWLPGIADGSEIWCQLFSEPEAGSDLANIALRAQRDGDSWVLSGQKVWVSRAAWARWGFALARSAPESPKHRGLTAFVVDMNDPGIEVRPLRQMNEDRHFSEVFLNDVVVPDSWRVGDENNGWSIAMSLLARERSIAGKASNSAWNDLAAWLREHMNSGSPTAAQRDQIMRWFVESAVAQLAGLIERSGSGAASGGSLDKLRKSSLFKTEANLRLGALGAQGMLSDSPATLMWLTSPSMSIRGGTDQIQRNIVAERLLGLPPDPRLDRDIPWTESRRGGKI
jgi:alkylation response protein AidB-like acyl-CoA dehydrogenase